MFVTEHFSRFVPEDFYGQKTAENTRGDLSGI